MNFLTVFKSSK